MIPTVYNVVYLLIHSTLCGDHCRMTAAAVASGGTTMYLFIRMAKSNGHYKASLILVCMSGRY